MSTKCIRVCVCLFGIFSIVLWWICYCWLPLPFQPALEQTQASLMLFFPGIQCSIDDQSERSMGRLKFPSLKSFIRASTIVEDRLSGLAVFSKLANACQPPVDVSKSKILVNKIALISLANVTVCSLQELAVNAQNAGYSMVMCFDCYGLPASDNGTQTEDKLLIPVAYIISGCQNITVTSDESQWAIWINDSQLLAADQTNVEIRIPVLGSDDLSNMGDYLERLYFWFLLGPIITLEWLRRTKKLCCNSGRGQPVDRGQVDDEERATGDVEEQALETEERPLLTVMNDPRTNLSVTEHTRHIAIHRRVTIFFGNVLKIYKSKVPVGFVYAIAIIAALPLLFSWCNERSRLEITRTSSDS